MSKKDAKTENAHRVVVMDYLGKEIQVELSSKFDMSGFDKDTILNWYKINHLGRKLDEKAALYLKMAKGWSYHASFAGHDGIQLAMGLSFRQKVDYIFPYFRDMLTVLAGGISPYEIILNGLSKESDVAGGGRHMSNHFAKQELNIQNVSSCTGNHSLHACGVARAIKYYHADAVAIYSGGESASSEGYFFEALNGSTIEKLPVVFVIQNNKYGISVPVREQSANPNVSDNYRGFNNLKIINVDGRDPFDSWRGMQSAIENAKAGLGPAVVHADCDRMGSHSNSDRHELYRDDDELNAVKMRDPLMQFRWHIIDNKIATLAELEELEEKNKVEMFAAADRAEAEPPADGKGWPQFIVPAPIIPNDSKADEIAPASDAKTITYIEAINFALKHEFRLNPDTFLWGQDVASKDKGGVFNVCKGMMKEFGNDRVFNAPIAEDYIVGTANGMTRFNKDIRVVVEGAEFADYFWPAMEQLVETSHEYWRTKGSFSPNFVIRLASGGYIQGGLYHSQNLEGVLATFPGIRIVSPAFADDAIGLLRTAVRSQGLTLYLEPKFLYNFKGAHTLMPTDDFMVPFGKGKIRREGKDLTIVSYGTAVHWSLQAAIELEKQNISAEVIDLRSIMPWDKEMVFNSIKKTNRVLIAHEDKLQGGFGGEISAEISANCFKYLDAPVMRIGSKNSPVGFAKSYDVEILLKPEEVFSAALELFKF